MITKEMSITDIVEQHPETIEIFGQYGLHCIGCFAAQFESLNEGAMAHGIDIDALVKDLNACVEAK